ncbi:MAG TPA: ABC transporter ATP-binding protein [Rhizomicrobium sp.]|jgi:iron complex transport system ATP-binding protein|nr:ABC transporter ATP-binding protein [Rhizomicrobium sp.]
MSVLLAEHLSVNRGGRAILNDVSLMAGPGDFVAVIGPNGAGKSTLLSALAGLVVPANGEISLNGVPLHKIPRKVLARRRAYLPQNPLCEWPLSVERLVALGLTAHLPALGSFPAWFDDAIAAALKDHDLASRREQPVTTLSGGEFSRAMLARAMVGRPDILIVDEPVTGLDPVHAFTAMARLSAWAAAGHAVIASLHDLTLAGRYATRVLALKEGSLAGEGALDGALIRNVFGVAAEIRGTGSHFAVDFLTPKAGTDDRF